MNEYDSEQTKIDIQDRIRRKQAWKDSPKFSIGDTSAEVTEYGLTVSRLSHKDADRILDDGLERVKEVDTGLKQDKRIIGTDSYAPGGMYPEIDKWFIKHPEDKKTYEQAVQAGKSVYLEWHSEERGVPSLKIAVSEHKDPSRRGTFRDRLLNKAVQKGAFRVESAIERRLGIETIPVEMLEQLDRVVAALPEGSSRELLLKFEKPVEAGGRALEAVMNLLDFGWEIVRDTISEEGGKKKAVGFTPGKLPSFLTVLGIRGLGRLGEAIAKKPKGEEKIEKTAEIFERFIPEEPRKNDRRGHEGYRQYYGSGRPSHEEHRNEHGQEGRYRQKNDFREPRQIHYGQSR